METLLHIVPGTYNMHNMFKMHDIQNTSNRFALVTQGGKILDMDLVLGRISSTIQIVPLNENQRDPDELT
jgi:hypothetical protein